MWTGSMRWDPLNWNNSCDCGTYCQKLILTEWQCTHDPIHLNRSGSLPGNQTRVSVSRNVFEREKRRESWGNIAKMDLLAAGRLSKPLLSPNQRRINKKRGFCLHFIIKKNRSRINNTNKEFKEKQEDRATVYLGIFELISVSHCCPICKSLISFYLSWF